MKSKMIVLALAVMLGMAIYPIVGYAQMGSGMMGRGGDWEQGYNPQQEGGWNYCPYCGSPMGPGGGYGMGPGMMGRGYGMGPGMMGRGYGMGPGMMGPQYGPQYQQQQKPMEEKDAKEILEYYLRSTRNPNLKLGKITEKDNYFEAEILTRADSLVDKIIIDRYTGWMRSIY